MEQGTPTPLPVPGGVEGVTAGLGPDASWRWPEERWRQAVNKVRAGRPLRPTTWPQGAQVAVALSFDVDQETLSLRDGKTSPALLAQGEYGSRAGLPRILKFLERHAIPASFYVPGVSALLHPDDVRAIAAAGHEVGLHGWIHERTSNLAEADERDLTHRAADVLHKLAGKPPVGLRTASWDFSDATLQIVREMGLLYDSSMMSDDEPYELVEDGVPTGIVELPVEWIKDDYPYFGMDRLSPIRPYTAPSLVSEIWRREFDGAYVERGLFLLTMHPHIIGHRSRMSWCSIYAPVLGCGSPRTNRLPATSKTTRAKVRGGPIQSQGVSLDLAEPKAPAPLGRGRGVRAPWLLEQSPSP